MSPSLHSLNVYDYTGQYLTAHKRAPEGDLVKPVIAISWLEAGSEEGHLSTWLVCHDNSCPVVVCTSVASHGL